MPILTDSQKKAHDLSRHLSVTANAGSGKTTVLVNRFVDILEHTDARIQELVAITYTEKAASELRRKIASVIEARLAESENPMRRSKLEIAREQLSSANVGTIHSFCGQLLREFPIEAGVDAAFSVIEEVDRDFTIAEIVQSVVNKILRAEGEEDGSVLAQDSRFVLRSIGWYQVDKMLREFLRQRDQIDRMISDVGPFGNGQSDEEISRRWIALVEEEMQRMLGDERWLQSAERLTEAASGKDRGPVFDSLHRWKSDLPLSMRQTLYVEIVDTILTTTDSLRKSFLGKSLITEVAEVDCAFLASHRKDVRSTIAADPVECEKNHQQMIRQTRTLLAIYAQVRDEYDKKKLLAGELDFEDLLLRTRVLLRNDKIAGRIAERFRFVMIDEYQDTNLLQYEITLGLVRHFQRGNLFIVGDPKQSIYGFRNADVEVFDQTRQDIARQSAMVSDFSHSGEILTGTEVEKGGLITLAHSFRLLKDIVAFVNLIFSRAMATASSPHAGFDVAYDDLVHARPNEASGRVELLLVRKENSGDEEEGSDAESRATKECLLIARRLRELEVNSYPVFDGASETTRPFRFNDVAILLRSRTKLPALEKALIEHQIPYQISGGIGFYQRQEIYDYFNYFRFLLNRHDDVALAGILRSPFFGLSDSELYQIAIATDGTDYWSKFSCIAQSTGSKELLRVYEILNDNLGLANRLTIPMLVQRILNQTGWMGIAAGLQQGAQVYANVQKLLRMAREFEDRGLATLFDFVNRLSTLLSSEREGQASLDLEGNAVHIMTIHAAKGLEFPVVFIPFCSQRFRHDSPPYIDAAIGVGFKTTNEDNFDEEVEAPIFTFLKQRAHAKRIAEEKRIFYVATTRARDMLVLSGIANPHPPSESYLGWVMRALAIDPSGVTEGERKIDELRLKRLIFEDGRYRPAEEKYHLSLKICIDVPIHSTIDASGDRQEGDLTLGEINVQPVQAQLSRGFYSATQLRIYFECPTKYYLRYQLGMPETGSLPYEFGEDDDPNDRLIGELEGSLAHEIFQTLDSEATNELEIRERVSSRLNANPQLDKSQRLSLERQLLSHVWGFVSSDFGRRVLEATQFHVEYTINMAFGEDYLTGTLDRLYHDPKDGWCIIDYKTDRFRPDQVNSRLDRYRPQLGIYALLVSKLFNQPIVRAEIVFTSHPGENLRIDFDATALRGLELSVEDALMKIRRGEFDRTETHCQTCSYKLNGKCILPVMALAGGR